MTSSDILMLFGGLGLFLYGMKMMSTGLEVAAGNKLKTILEKLTSNRILGVVVGAVITAIIQSSSATTVMVVGFVNSGLMSLSRAVWIIMGANIGTTITGQLIALDVGALAPIFAFIGVVMVVFFKNKKTNCIGEIIAGLGILFLGMNLMSDAMSPLRDSETFAHLMTSFQNPLLGILAGALFTAVIQSSSASIGILQALASSGVIGLGSAVYVLFGQNIGTCITALLASIGTNKNAKRTTLIHFMFNIIGTLIFVPLCMLTPLTDWIITTAPTNVASQIANMHTLFNIVTTLILLPFGMHLVKLAIKLLPGEERSSNLKHLVFVDEHNMGSIAIATTQLTKEVYHMFNLANSNFQKVFYALLHNKALDQASIIENEQYLDTLNTEITHYVSRVSSYSSSESDAKTLSSLFKLTADIERIGDHAFNIFEDIQIIREQGIHLSDTAIQELTEMHAILSNSFDIIHKAKIEHLSEDLKSISYAEDQIDMMNEEFRANLMIRMNKQLCSAESSFAYSQMLIDIERISDHLLNIIQILHGSYLVLNQGD
ncbi:MAG: Na/Pi cotransporter family protein [Cellulosilyticaceae bacterium]